MSAGLSKRLQMHLQIAPAQGTKYSLDNSDDWFDKVVGIPETRKWIENAALRGQRIYIIVGYQTFTDASIMQKSIKHQEASGKMKIPLGLPLSSATSVMPLAQLTESGAHGEHLHMDTDQIWLVAPGEQVCALQYREIKTRWFSSKLANPPQLASTRQWSCLEGDRRDAFDDTDEEEEDEDAIEADLVDLQKLDEKWNSEECVEGIIYLHD